MKKLICALLIISMCIMPIQALAAERLGYTVYTDIVTYINHNPIPSYNFNGMTLIAAEDLNSYGFDVFWNEYARTLTINRNKSKNDILPELTFRPLERQLGKRNFAVTTTDVRVFTGNYQYSSFGGLDGKTMINVNDLVCIDNVSVVWVPEVKAVKVWIDDGLEMRSQPFDVRRMDEHFTYYTSCEGLDSWITWDWFDSPTSTCITLAETIGKNSDLCTDCDARIEITDVIDADGRSRLKHGKTVYKFSTPTTVPYFYGLSDKFLSHSIILTNSDLYPDTASGHGGLIKLTYECSYHSYDIDIRVDCLPYEDNSDTI